MESYPKCTGSGAGAWASAVLTATLIAGGALMGAALCHLLTGGVL